MKESDTTSSPIFVGASACVLGMKVRYDGGHKRDRFITDMLARYFEFIPVCPEVEVGMGVPRESVRLVGDPDEPRMLGFKSGKDWTDKMRSFCKRRVRELREYALSGYIFKSKSPSCGIARVRLRSSSGGSTHRLTVGLHAREVMEQYPLLPIEDEGRLNDAGLRENFIVRVFAYNRLQKLFEGRFTNSGVVRFHTAHKYLILAHDPKRFRESGRLVAGMKQLRPTEFTERYSRMFMEALKLKATIKKNVNVLLHIVGFFKKHLESSDKAYLLQTIEDYHKGLVPLVVPITMIRHYVQKFDVEYLKNQVYIDPHPKELMLRNHT
jgi:uncharacterized protein YbgA (DUF1722 family)/uncharacterized protein YbbK (DUF523 family)